MGKYRVRHLEGQECIRKQKKRTMKMSKSRGLGNGKSDFTEAGASSARSSILKKITKLTAKFLLDLATWTNFVAIEKTSVVFACPTCLSSFDNKASISL